MFLYCHLEYILNFEQLTLITQFILIIFLYILYKLLKKYRFNILKQEVKFKTTDYIFKLIFNIFLI